MRGASAIQELLGQVPDETLRVLVVWEPVLWTDLGPPLSMVLSRISDRRATQYWDADGALSRAMVQGVVERRSPMPCEELNDTESVVWDFVAFFPPGERWEEAPPTPAFCGAPVVRHLEEIRRVCSPS